MSASKIPQTCGTRFCSDTFNRLARSAFPAATKFYLSQVTGIPARTIERHLDGSTKPSADHLIAYLNAGAFGARLRDLILDQERKATAAPAVPSHSGSEAARVSANKSDILFAPSCHHPEAKGVEDESARGMGKEKTGRAGTA